MTVSSSTDRATFLGNDATTVFALPFRFFANGEINAWLITNASGALTALTLGTHYTLTGASDPEVDGSATGQLTMITPPTSAQSLFVQRIIPVTQPTDIVNQGQFFPEIHENVFDRLTMLNQQNAGALARTIRVQDFDPEPAKLPSAALRALKIMSFDADGNPVAIDAATDSSLVLRQDLADDTDPAKGAGLLGLLGRTVKAKLGNHANVLDDNGSGSADPSGLVDSTAAFLAAINLGTGSVYVPAGTYLLNLTSIPSGTILFGDGKKTILKPLTPEVRAAIAINSGSATTFIDDLTFYNLTFQGSVAVDLFSEQKHLLTLNGVRNALVYRCWFLGSRGDGIYIGSGDAGGTEKHNRNVKVIDCYFDGETKDNRNAISVIDGDDVTIAGNYFTRYTRSNMPGAVDIEPNANTYHVVRNIKILNNHFVDIGGNVAAVAFPIPGIGYTTAPTDFRVEGNHFNNVQTAYHFNFNVVGGVVESNVPHSVVFRDNQVQTAARPFNILNVHTALLENNRHFNCTSEAMLGFNTADYNIFDAKISNNLFYKCGSTSGKGLSVFKGTRISLDGNVFNDCGTGVAGSAIALQFNTGTSANVALTGNKFISPTGKTLVAIQKEAGHTFTANTNSFYGNDLNGLTNGFQSSANEAAVPVYTAEGAAFVPVVSGATAAGAGTYTTQAGFYTKVGKLISFSLEVAWSAHTGTGQIYVSLPEPTNANLPGFHATTLVSSGITLAAGAQAKGLINKAPASRVQVYTTNAGALAALSVPASGTLYISGSYLAA